MSDGPFAPRSPDSEPRIFGLPPGVDFARALLDGLAARTDPLTCARTLLLVNTERAARRITALLEAAPASLAPRILPLGALPLLTPQVAQPEPPLRRRLQLAQLVRQAIAADPSLAARSTAYPLAETLAELAAEMQIEGVDAQTISALEVENGAAHWARSQHFLSLIGAVLDPNPGHAPTTLDPDARLRAAVEALTARWQTDPPQTPVIVAGSTGSRAVTADFMAAVARLPQGAVILPGFDLNTPPQVWDSLAQRGLDAPVDHPQWGLAQLCAQLGQTPDEVPLWDDRQAPDPTRARLVSLALRPAPVTDQWLTEGPLLAPDLPEATRDLTLIEAPDPLAEANALALRLRQAFAEGQTAALITPDRTLARRVTAALDRWRIAPDDSAGRPLDLTPPGTFLRLTASLLRGPPDAVTLLALLKHPLTASTTPDGRGRHIGQTARLEQALRRHSTPQVNDDLLAEHGDALEPAWRDWLAAALTARPATGPLTEVLARHLTLAHHLAAGVEGPADSSGALWLAEAGGAAQQTMADLAQHAPDGGTVPLAEYPSLLRAVLAATDVPDAPFAPRPDIAIWGTLEARTQTADVLLLGGLNEGTWPRLPQPDPWLSRQMRHAAGLPLPERRIGLAAHDFQQAIGQRTVVLSRALRSDGAPSLPARWLLRLTNLMSGLPPQGPEALDGMRARGRALLDQADGLQTPANPLPRAKRPAPVVPPGAFPGTLPVSTIDRLIRDPYAVYASAVLRLRPLDPLHPQADALERGIQMHAVMQAFIAATTSGLPPDPAPLLARIIDETLEARVPWPSIRAFWRQRLTTLIPFLVASERERRARAAPALLEASGEATLGTTPQPFTVTARADRIDASATGVAIYDYKSSLPGVAEAKTFHKQLPLEAAIALRDGFEGLQPQHILALELIGLSNAGKILPLSHNTEDIEQAWADLAILIGQYQTGAPMVSRLRPKFLRFESPYDHLARYGEWADGAAAEAEVLA